MPRILIALVRRDEGELGGDRDLVGERAAAVWQRCVPGDSVVAAIDGRLEREVGARLSRRVGRGRAPRAAGGDRTGGSLDPELPVDRGGAVLAERHVVRA